MNFIVVDTADARGSIAICRDAELLSLEAHTSEADYSAWLLPGAHRALARAGLTVSQLDAYAVCNGPGSFTGLRVGLTAVKAWSEIYGKPIAAISRLQALASATLDSNLQFVASFIDARRGQVFAALFERGAGTFEPHGEEAVIPLPEFVESVGGLTGGRPVQWATPDPELLRNLPDWRGLEAHGHQLQEVVPPFAPLLARLALHSFRHGRTLDSLSLDANYVRRSDAEVLWKGNKFPLSR